VTRDGSCQSQTLEREREREREEIREVIEGMKRVELGGADIEKRVIIIELP